MSSMSAMVTDTTPAAATALRIARGLGFLLAALFLIAALYYWFVPATIPSKEGVFGCGTAASPPTDGFAKGACQGTAKIHAFRSYALLGAALVTALGSFLLFRGERDDDWDEDVELGDPDERRARGGRGDVRERRELRGARRDRRDRDHDLDADSPERAEVRRPADRARELRETREDRPATAAGRSDDDWAADPGRGRDDLFGDEGGSPRSSRRRDRRERDEF